MINEDGALIELDGTKKGPLVIAESCESVLSGTVQEIKRRLEAGEISENLNMVSLNVNPDV